MNQRAIGQKETVMTKNVVRLDPRLRNFLSVGSVYPYSPFHPIEFDIGTPFEFIPNLPGVLILIGGDGRAISIEACDRSMRSRAIECWMGFGGADSVGAVRLAYETSNESAVREKQLVEEHRVTFGVVPRKNIA